MESIVCPKCRNWNEVVKSGFVNNKQRFLCKSCNYNFTVRKVGKKINNYYIVKAIQLYLEGLSLREIENVLGVSRSTISNWIKTYNIQKPHLGTYEPAYRILTFEELNAFLSKRENFSEKGVMITEFGSKFLLIRWKKTSNF